MVSVNDMLASDSSISSDVGFLDQVVGVLVEVLLLLALRGLLYNKERRAECSAPPRLGGQFLVSFLGEQRLECILLCCVLALAFHVETIIVAIAIAAGVKYMCVNRRGKRKAQHVREDTQAGKRNRAASSQPNPARNRVENRGAPPSDKPVLARNPMEKRVHPQAEKGAHARKQVENSATPQVEEATETDVGPRSPIELPKILQSEDYVNIWKPTAADLVLAQKIARMVKECVVSLVPEAMIDAAAGGNLHLMAAHGLQPEIEVVVTCDRAYMENKLKQYFLHADKQRETTLKLLEQRPLQTCTNTFSKRMKFLRFWRTQLNSPECKIVHVLPVESGLFGKPLYVHLSVNQPQALRMRHLSCSESAQCVNLMLLVRHWARMRCISNVARGQFSLYTWGTLALHFYRYKLENDSGAKTIVDCFLGFMQFYAALFADQSTSPSICFSADASWNSQSKSVPYIEDSLERGRDLSENTTAEGMARMEIELKRACTVLSRIDDHSMEELMVRWVAPEIAATPAARVSS